MISFDSETHTYTNEEGKKLVSVTTLLKQEGISPNYDCVNEDVLKAAADRGTYIHKEIEDYIKKGEIGFTTELQEFIRYIENNHLTVIASEKMVWNNVVAGTIDLILKTEMGNIIYADIKTTSQVHRQSVSWQLSIYKDLDLDFETENYQNYLNATLQVFHFDKEGNLTVKELAEVKTEQINKLYESIEKGEKYEVEIANDTLTELYEVEKIIAYYENLKKKAEEDAKLLRETIVNSMKEQGISKFENDKICISYIAPSTKETFDSATFKKEHPELWDQYKKTTQVKAQVRIILREKEDE